MQKYSYQNIEEMLINTNELICTIVHMLIPGIQSFFLPVSTLHALCLQKKTSTGHDFMPGGMAQMSIPEISLLLEVLPVFHCWCLLLI